MTTLLQRGATWLGERLQTSAGRTVKLTRGSVNTTDFVGAVSRVAYDEIGDDGLTTSVMYDDWTIVADEILLADRSIVPRDGDVISETLNGATVRYEVLPLQSRPAVEWLDSSGLLLTVHTKRIG